jgi:hypothetical protein
MINKTPFVIPFKGVDGLVIEETLANWWTKGWIILKNDFELIERGAKETIRRTAGADGTAQSQSVGDKIDPLYLFRHDGRNKINIRIFPVLDKAELVPKDNWEINYDFIVYDIEDLPSPNSTRKSKKLYFIDERYQLFNERNIPWSTATHGPAAKISQTPWKLSDEQRTMNANMALASIIKTAAGNDLGNQTALSNYKVGYNDSGSIDKPNLSIDVIDDSNWNSDGSLAADSEAAVLYTSTANATVIDDLNYVSYFTKGSDHGPVFLRFGRSTNNKKWQLLSLTDYFSKAEQIERLILQDGLESTQNIYTPRADIDTSKSNIINFTSGRASLIKKYKFTPMAAVDDARIINRPLHHYDFSTGEYSITHDGNRAVDVISKLKEIASKGLYNFTGGSRGKPQLLLNVNKTKSKGLSIVNHLSVQNHGPSNLSQIQMIKDSIFLNQGLYFQSEGLTFRTPGKFIFVDRTDSNEFNSFDDKFLGQWFVTKVTHFFTQEQYLTDVVATKIDSFNKCWDEEDPNY